MSTSETAIGPRPGLSNVVDIVVAPDSAFERLRRVPTWGWALLAGSVLGAIGSILAEPATWHAMQVSLPAKLHAAPQVMKMPADQQQRYVAGSMSFYHVLAQISFIFLPLLIMLAALFQALVMTITNAIAHGDGGFKKYFALSVTVSIIGIGLGTLVNALIVLVRGADSFETTTAVQGAQPSLALIVPGAKAALAGFLASFNVFFIWGTVLLALGMRRIGRIGTVPAWAAAIILLLITAAIGAWGGSQNG